MNAPISDRDLEMLSAYLDGHLTPGEWDRVSFLLQTRIEFQQALRDLTQTRQLLRTAPRLRVPRNFTLSAAFAKTKRRSPLVPTFAWASALSSVAAVFLFMVQLLSGSMMFGAGAPMAEAQEAAPALMMEMPAEESDQAETKAPPIIEWSPGAAVGMGGGGGPETMSTPAPGFYQPPPPEYVAPEASDLGAQSSAEGTLPTATSGTERTGEGITQSGPILGIRPTEQQGQISGAGETSDSFAASNEVALEQGPSSTRGNGLLLVSAIFAAVAVLSAILSLIFRFKR